MHNKALVLVLSSLVFGAACKKKNVIYMPVMNPAAVTVPVEIQRLAIVDRSRAKNNKERVMGAVEGAVTGEMPASDNRGREAAVQALEKVLADSPRFEVVVPTVTPKQVNSSLMDTPWTHRAVVKLCKEHGCDGVISLETFDTDSVITTGIIAPDSSGYNIETATHWANRQTTLRGTWRLYDAQGDRTIDELRDRSYGHNNRQNATSIAEATLKLADPSFGSMGGSLGRAYGTRIAPTWSHVGRQFYGGPGLMKQAKNHVLAQDWEGAVPLWREVIETSDNPKQQGKARMNLAIAAEVRGELDKAHRLAKKAAVELHNKTSRNYVAALKARKVARDKLLEQLAAPEEDSN